MIYAGQKWNYDFPMPASDLRTKPQLVPPGFSVRMRGVDGRFVGGLRRFPGMSLVDDVTSRGERMGVASAFSSAFCSAFQPPKTIQFFKYAELQKGIRPHRLRGFLIQWGPALWFHYYDTENATWHDAQLGVYSPVPVDATYLGRFMYIAVPGTQSKTVYWDDATSTFVTTLMGHVGNPGRWVRPYETWAGASVNGAILVPKDGLTHFLSIGWRFGNSVRNVWSPIETQTAMWVEPAGVGFTRYLAGYPEIRLRIPKALMPYYDTVEIYRTVLDGGTLYREVYYHVPTEDGGSSLLDLRGNGNNGAYTLGEITGDFTDLYVMLGVRQGVNPTTFNGSYLLGFHGDAELPYLQSYDIDTDDPGEPPQATKIFAMDGTVYLSRDDAASEDLAVTQWSRLDLPGQKETFPPLNFYQASRLSDNLVRLISSGDYVFGLAPSRLFRFTKKGAIMAVEKVLHGWGILNTNAVCEMGADLIFAGESTLSQVNADSANITTIGSVERKLIGPGEWESDPSQVYLVFDAHLQCLFMVNPVKEEAVCIWGTTTCVTELGDFRFSKGTSGPDPVTGGIDRAFFLQVEGTNYVRVFTTNVHRTGLQNMMGAVAGTLNGTLVAGNTTTVTGAPGTQFYVSMVGGYIYVFTNGNWVKRRITAVGMPGDIALTVDTPLTVATGDRFSVAPVVFEWIGDSLGTDADPRAPHQVFRIRKTISMGFDVDVVGGQTDSVNAKISVGAYKHLGLTPLVETEVPITEIPAQNFGKVAAQGGLMFPSLRCFASDLDFELLGAVVTGSLEESMKG